MNANSKFRTAMSNRLQHIRVHSRSFAVFTVILLATSTGLARAASQLADTVEKSDRTAIRTLLKQHADVNAPQADGMTALHWAARLDDLETARLLLKAGANAKATNNYGVAPLSLACQNGNGELVEL